MTMLKWWGNATVQFCEKAVSIEASWITVTRHRLLNQLPVSSKSSIFISLNSGFIQVLNAGSFNWEKTFVQCKQFLSTYCNWGDYALSLMKDSLITEGRRMITLSTSAIPVSILSPKPNLFWEISHSCQNLKFQRFSYNDQALFHQCWIGKKQNT